MYTEGFEGLGEAEKGSRRAYVSNVSQDDADRLMRENERLKKQLEKEKFFNKLLDQEIQELKNNTGQAEPHFSQYWYGSRGVSKGAFYGLLFISLAMGAYIGYGIYYDKQFDYLKEFQPAATSTPAETGNNFSTPSDNIQKSNNGQVQPNTTPKEDNTVKSGADQTQATQISDPVEEASTPRPPIRDSVPNIIATNKQNASAKQKSGPVVPDPAEEYTEIDVETEIADLPTEVVDTRPVISRYKVISKANFYNKPDENALRGTFISQGDDKVVGALEEKNGFIFVVYTNDLGYTTKGWLSKKDLSKFE